MSSNIHMPAGEGGSPPGPPKPAVAEQARTAVPVAAPGGWFVCDVHYTGPTTGGTPPGGANIGLLDRANSWGTQPRWYLAPQGLVTEMLATALTAVSTGYPVTVQLPSTDEYSQIIQLFLHSKWTS